MNFNISISDTTNIVQLDGNDSITFSESKSELETCDKCDYKLTEKGNLDEHYNSTHKKLFFTCDKCDYKHTQTRET